MIHRHKILRQRMNVDMVLRNMLPNSQKVYVWAVASFSVFHNRSHDKLSMDNVQTYRGHLIGRGLKPSSINPIVGTLRFFYGITLTRKDIAV